MNTTLMVVIALMVGIILGAAVIYAIQLGRTRRLKERFGPEYGRVVAETGNWSRAEAMLEDRQKRVRQFHNPTAELDRTNALSRWLARHSGTIRG